MIILKAHAKINLFINVLGKREDGFHELEMIMQMLDLHDIVRLEKADSIEISCSDPRIPLDSRNVVHKAVSLIAGDYPEVRGAHIHIEKNIPSEAGLAGGSSDAAAVIRGISELYGLNLGIEKMEQYGQQIGSDVNFFFRGPTSFASGRGELIRDIKPLPPLYVVLLKPSAGLSTAEVYRNLGSPQKHKDIEHLINAINCEDIPFLLRNLYNGLEESSFRLLPFLKEIKERMVSENPFSLMSGSGTTFFSLFFEKNEAKRFLNKFEDQFEFSVLTEFLQKDPLISK